MEDLLVQLARQFQNKYYGKYRGFVVDNEDPEQLGRLRLTVPSVFGEAETGWALPCLPFGGLADQGTYLLPENGAQVWVEFEAGNINHPIWTGTFWQQTGDLPSEAESPTNRLMKTPAGHRLQFDDENGREKITLYHSQGAELLIDENGSVAITDSQGSSVKLDAEAGRLVIEDVNGNTITMTSAGTTVEDANGNKIEMGPAGINVKGQQIVIEGTQVMVGGQGGEPVIKGQTFLTLFATHVHPSAMGPTGPPIPQGEMSSLSMKVTSA